MRPLAKVVTVNCFTMLSNYIPYFVLYFTYCVKTSLRDGLRW